MLGRAADRLREPAHVHRDVTLRRAMDATGDRTGAGAAPCRGVRARADRLERRDAVDTELGAREREAAADSEIVVREPGARAQQLALSK